MALAAFVISGLLGLVAAIFSSVALGFGFLAAFGIYVLISTSLPVLALIVMVDRGHGTPEGGVLVTART